VKEKLGTRRAGSNLPCASQLEGFPGTNSIGEGKVRNVNRVTKVGVTDRDRGSPCNPSFISRIYDAAT
jgi:hypothetical protein